MITKYDFFEVYRSLSDETKEEIDDKLESLAELQEKHDELSEHIRALSPEQLADLERSGEEFAEETKEEIQSILEAEYAHDDPEERESARQVDLANAQEHADDILTTEYPVGLEILENKMDEIKDEILELLPDKLFAKGR